ncbi:MAG: host attachment protein [Pseudomonadota bacterium]
MAQSNLETLIASEGFPRVSIYLQTRERGNDIHADALKLKNAVKAAEKQLAESGMDEEDVAPLFREAHELIEDHEFWRYSRKGLGVFIEPGRTRLIKLHAEPHEVTVVAGRYHVRPLIHILKDGDTFYILAVTRESVRLLEATTRGEATAQQVDLESAPDSINEEKERTNYEDLAGFHSRSRGSGGTPKYHSLGRAPDELDEVQLEEFTRDVAKSVEHFLLQSAHDAPLVLAANDRTLGRIREHFDRDNLVGEAINKDPGSMTDAQIVEAARELAGGHVGRARKQAVGRLEAWNGGDPDIGGAKSIEDLWRAAQEGRVGAAFINRRAVVWGTLSEDGQSFERKDEETAETEDLINALACKVLAQGGEVYALPDDHKDKLGPVAGTFRY